MSCTYANTLKNWKQKAATGEIMIGCATIESSKGLSCTDAESATYRNQFPTMTLITSIEYKQLHLFSTYVIRMAGRYAERLIWLLNAEIRHEQQKNLKRASREPTHFFRRINLCNFTKQYRMRSWPPMCQRKERSNAECQIHVLTTKSPVWGCEQYSMTVFKYSTSNWIIKFFGLKIVLSNFLVCLLGTRDLQDNVKLQFTLILGCIIIFFYGFYLLYEQIHTHWII